MIEFADLWIGRLVLVGAFVGAALWWWVWVGVRVDYHLSRCGDGRRGKGSSRS